MRIASFVRARDLPARYQGFWRAPFYERVDQLIRPGMSVLDVGAGRSPIIPPERRPAGVVYVGLDISASELAMAGPEAYDETWVGDVTRRIPELEGRFDLILSWQVLEHVKPLGAAFDNFHAYLCPRGRFVGHFSGTFSFFGLAGRLTPHRLIRWLVGRGHERPPDSVFPAYYHRCWDGALRRILAPWARAEIVPRYTGATYLGFLPPAQRLYLVYEDWAMRSGRRDLATHYLVDAER